MLVGSPESRLSYAVYYYVVAHRELTDIKFEQRRNAFVSIHCYGGWVTVHSCCAAKIQHLTVTDEHLQIRLEKFNLQNENDNDDDNH